MIIVDYQEKQINKQMKNFELDVSTFGGGGQNFISFHFFEKETIIKIIVVVIF